MSVPMLTLAPLQPSDRSVRHGFFTRQGGVSTGIYQSLNCGFGSHDDRVAVWENRQRIAQQLGSDRDQLLSVNQVHGCDVAIVTEPWDTGAAPTADAMATDQPGLALAILTADCAPVLFADPERRIVGAAHAGWRGALAGITDATIVAMESLGSDRRAIVAGIGPTIGPGSYEVGSDLHSRFVLDDDGNDRFFRPADRRGHFLFDLPGYLRGRLTRSGIGRVASVEQDTLSDPKRFFSYRRACHAGEVDYGRQVSAIMLS